MMLINTLRYCLLLCVMCFSAVANAASCAPEILAVYVARDLTPEPRELPVAQPPAIESIAWEPASSPHYWQALWPDYQGRVWYRVDWQCAQGAQPQWAAMLVDSVVIAAAIYVNNDLIWRDKNLVEPVSRSWNMPRYLLFPPSAMHEGVNHVWFHVYGVAQQRAGLGVVELGEPHTIQQRYSEKMQSQRQILELNLVISALLSLLAGVVWLYRRSEHAFGLYSLLSLAWVLFGLTVVITETSPFSNSLVFTQVSTGCYLLLIYCMALFLWSVVEGAATTWVKQGFLGVGLVLGLYYVWQNTWEAVQLAGNLYTLLLSIICVHLLYYTIKKPNKTNITVAIFLVIIVFSAQRDYLMLTGVIEGKNYYTHYICFFSLILAAFLLARRVASSARRIERFNLELQEAVVSACRDLETTLASEHKLLLDNSLLQERLQLAHELHDGLGGQISRSIALLEHNTDGLDKTRMLAMLKVLRNDLRQVIDSDASAAAKVPETPLIWLASVRHRFVTLFDELDIRSRWHIPSQWQQPPNAAQCLAFIRLLEEALTNVTKHSRATEVDISLEFPSDWQIQLTISDNGVGFDTSLVAPSLGGIGMSSMRERMLRQQGELLVHSEPGLTRLIARMAIKPS